jgi:hypothetical protein
MNLYEQLSSLDEQIGYAVYPYVTDYGDAFWIAVFGLLALTATWRLLPKNILGPLAVTIALVALVFIGYHFGAFLMDWSGHWRHEWDDMKYGIFAGAFFLIYPIRVNYRLALMFAAMIVYTLFAAKVGFDYDIGGGMVHLAIILLGHAIILGSVTRAVNRSGWLVSIPVLGILASLAVIGQQFWIYFSQSA